MTDAPLDYAALFAHTPSPCLVLDPSLVIREANRAYLEATGREREDLVGRPLFEAFPANPDDPYSASTENVRASLERARDTRRPDAMGVQRYDIAVPGTGGFTERHWSPVNVPVLDEHGHVALLLHRVLDVTDYVRHRDHVRLEAAEADVLERSQELAAAYAELHRAREREREVAVTLQRAMLPEPAAAPPGFEVAVRYRPAVDALAVGGDWYDLVPLRPDCVSVAVGDVAGKGLPAAAVMGQLRSALTAATYGAQGPPQALEVLDRYADTVEGALGATVVQVLLNRPAATVRYSTAGHPPAALWLPGEGVRLLRDATGPPLAALESGTPRPTATAPLPPGAAVVLYSDGLVERRGRDPDVGFAALTAAVEAHAELPVEALADAVLADLLADGAAQDDVALLVARSARD